MTSEISWLVRAAYGLRQFQVSLKTAETAFVGEEVTP